MLIVQHHDEEMREDKDDVLLKYEKKAKRRLRSNYCDDVNNQNIEKHLPRGIYETEGCITADVFTLNECTTEVHSDSTVHIESPCSTFQSIDAIRTSSSCTDIGKTSSDVSLSCEYTEFPTDGVVEKVYTTGSSPLPPPLPTQDVSNTPSSTPPSLSHRRPPKRKSGKRRTKLESQSYACNASVKLQSKWIDEWARKLGVKLYKDFEYASLDPRYSNSYRSPKLSADRLSVVGTKGWASILSNVCADKGSWYFEVTLKPPDKAWEELKLFGWEGCATIRQMIDVLPSMEERYIPSIRVGWGTRMMKLGAPVGANAFGYCIAQRNGNTAHNGKMQTKGGYNKRIPKDSVVGCYLHIDGSIDDCVSSDPRMCEGLWTFLKAGLLCNTTSDATLPPRIPVKGSFIEFSVNGVLLGKAFYNIHAAEYHPCISLYNMGGAKINLGPTFAYPPSNDLFRPACEMQRSRYPCKEDLIKCWVYIDEVEETTAEGEKIFRKRTIAEVEGLLYNK